MKHTTTLLLGVFATTSLMAADLDLSKLPPASTQKDVTYAKDIRPIFEASCFGCHGERQQRGGLRLDSHEAVLKGSKEGKVIEVGDGLKSHLVIAVSQLDPQMTMPPKPRARGGPGGQAGTNAPAAGPGQRPGGPGGPAGPPTKPLTPEQVGLVRAWVDQGAK